MAVTSGISATNYTNNNMFWVRWSIYGSQDITNNKTQIYWEAGCTLGHKYYSNAIRMSAVTIDGRQVYAGGTYSNLYNGEHVLASGYLDIEHNGDGTKSFAIEGFTGWLYSNENFSANRQSFELPTIPRASILYVSQGTINSANPTFTIDKKSNSFTDSLYYVNPANNQEELIASNVTSRTYTSWTPPSSLYASFPNAQYIYMTFKSYTYNGNTLVGSNTAYAYIYANANECRPTVSVTATPTDYSSLTGSATTLIKGVSNVAISVTATPKYSASITSISTNNVALSTNSTTGSRTFTAVETNTFLTAAADSRGFVTTPADEKPFTMVDYIKLSVSANVYRTNQTSSTIKAKVTGNYYDGNFTSQGVANTLTLTWKCKNNESDSWTTGGTLTATKSNGTYDTGEVTLTMPSGINSDYEHTIYFLFTAEDKVYSGNNARTAAPTVKKGEPIFDYGVDSWGRNYFWANADMYEKGCRLAYSDTVLAFASSQINMTIPQAWTSYKVPLDTADITGTALSFDTTNKRILVNKTGYVDLIGQFDIYTDGYVNGDYSLQVWKNGTQWLPLSYESIRNNKTFDKLTGIYPFAYVTAGDYLELYLNCGNTGTVRTFAGVLTSLAARFIKIL